MPQNGIKAHAPDQAIAVDAARLRARHPISLPDGYLLATARRLGADLASFDRRLLRAAATEGLRGRCARAPTPRTCRAGTYGGLAAADAFLKAWIPWIREPGGGRVGLLLLSGDLKAPGSLSRLTAQLTGMPSSGPIRPLGFERVRSVRVGRRAVAARPAAQITEKADPGAGRPLPPSRGAE